MKVFPMRFFSNHAFDTRETRECHRVKTSSLSGLLGICIIFFPHNSILSQAILGYGEVVKIEVHQFSTQFPQQETQTLTMSMDPVQDLLFREAEVNMLRTEKAMDVERYHQEVRI